MQEQHSRRKHGRDSGVGVGAMLSCSLCRVVSSGAGMAHPVMLVKDRWPWVGSLGCTEMGWLTAMTLLEVYTMLTKLLLMLLK